MTPALARLDHVTHRYGTTTALDDISLDLPAGCRIAVIGPDGVGKSSLLALIAGARKIQTGQITLFEENLRKRPARTRLQQRLAYLPQGLGRNVYPSLSIEENIDAFARLFSLPPAARRERIELLLAATSLTPYRHRPAAQLSGGMKQKLGLCCALVHDPELLILDEPTTGIDPLSRRQFWELIAHLRSRRPNMSVLVSTAYMEEAEHFDWLIAMDQGRVLGAGTVTALKAQTDSRTLEEAFVRMLPATRRGAHRALTIPPRPAGVAEIAVEASHLTKTFDDFKAVDDVSFAIETGEIFGFVGSNGCGKTTTMKMLTGLLSPTSGQARLFGAALEANHDSRTRVGYMSQAFSLYSELTVRQNLVLHARLFRLSPAQRRARIDTLTQQFELTAYLDTPATQLPLGIRQRLSLAVALVHEPRLLILDEPTSGVDPIARDAFWAQLIRLAREQQVTIFISTHFMNEAERCDRVTLMHEGRVLAIGTPNQLCANKGVATLEEAFIAHLQQGAPPVPIASLAPAGLPAPVGHRAFSLARLLGIAHRESLELIRDPVRVAFALVGSIVLMFVLGYGISMDVENLRFAVLDRDQSPASRDYIHNLAGSRYFIEQPELTDDNDMTRRMASGELALALEIPPNFGRDLKAGRTPEIGAWLDGALPYRGETARGYLEGLHQAYLTQLTPPSRVTVTLSPRYRYNQDFRSLDAMVPAVIPLLLIFLPAILTALGVVREKELGSIVNLYVTPVTRLEFFLGKQLPYLCLAMLSFLALLLQAVFIFKVPIKGSLATLTLGTLLYVISTTGLGLMISTFTRTQIGALFGTAIVTMLPTVQFSGLTTPVASLQGAAYWVGQGFPAAYHLVLSRGVFTKALQFEDLTLQLVALAAFIPIITSITVLLLPKQAR